MGGLFGGRGVAPSPRITSLVSTVMLCCDFRMGQLCCNCLSAQSGVCARCRNCAASVPSRDFAPDAGSRKNQVAVERWADSLRLSLNRSRLKPNPVIHYPLELEWKASRSLTIHLEFTGSTDGFNGISGHGFRGPFLDKAALAAHPARSRPTCLPRNLPDEHQHMTSATHREK